MSMSTRKTAVLVATQSVAGVAEALTASTDQIYVSNPQLNWDPQTLQSPEVTGTLDDNEGTEVTSMRGGCTFDIDVAGEGAAGTAPRWSKILQAGGWQEQLTPSAIGQTNCQAGGSTTTVVLDAGASSTDDFYRGLPIVLSGDMTADSMIVSYDGTSKTATVATELPGSPGASTTYEIPPNVMYRPGSGTPAMLTVGFYIDGVKYVFEGCRANVQVIYGTNDIVKLRVTLQGNFVSETDEQAPVASYTRLAKAKFLDGKALMDRAPVSVSSISLDPQNSVTFDPNPNQAQGFDAAEITGRNMQLTMDPALEGVATRATVANLQNSTEYLVHALAGKAAGSRIAMITPRAMTSGLSGGDRSNVATQQLTLACKGPNAGAFLTLY